MELQVIKELVNEFKGAELTKLSLKCEQFELTLEKETPKVISDQVMQVPNMSLTSAMQVSQNTSEKVEGVQSKKITSPMVGTFYASSSPETEAFASVGSKVKKGDVICIIEAMKLMNEVEAEEDGEIVEVLVKNEQMVEYGQPLFVIK